MSKSISRSIRLTAGAVALVLAACRPAPTADAGGANTPAAALDANATAALQAMDVERLRALAAGAVAEQRIHGPAGMNAVEYYLALRDKQPADAAIGTALVELQPYVLIAGEQALARGEARDAERLLALLACMDADAPALPRLRDALVRLHAAVAEREAALVAAETASVERLMRAPATDAIVSTEAARPVVAPAPPASPPQTASSTASRMPGPAASPAPAQPVDSVPVPATAAADAESRPSPPAAPAAQALPRLLRDTPPHYPQAALNRRLEGRVEVAFTIQPDGSVGDAKVVSANPEGVFDRAALTAASRWRFEASGQRVSTRRTLTFRVPSG